MTDQPTQPVAEALTDSDKLRVLATWFDHFDDWREATGKIAPGIAEYRDVQNDLRRIADTLDAARSQPIADTTASHDLDDCRAAIEEWEAAQPVHLGCGCVSGTHPNTVEAMHEAHPDVLGWDATGDPHLHMHPLDTTAPRALGELRAEVADLRYSRPLMSGTPEYHLWQRNEETVAYVLERIDRAIGAAGEGLDPDDTNAPPA